MRLQPEQRPPMNLQQLMRGCDLLPSLEAQIETLVAAKSQTREKELGSRLPEIDAFIATELDQADTLPIREAPAHAVAIATEIFREAVNSD